MAASHYQIDLPPPPLTKIPGIGAFFASRLANLGLHTFFDILLHLPLRYEDRTVITPIRHCAKEGADLKGIVGTIVSVQPPLRNRPQWSVIIQDETGSLQLSWMRAYKTYEKRMVVGARILAFGVVKTFRHNLSIMHPEVTFLKPDEPPSLPSYYYAIYPTTAGLSQGILRKCVRYALGWCKTISDPNAAIAKEKGLPSLYEAFVRIHQCPKGEPLERISFSDSAIQRLKWDESGIVHIKQKIVVQHKIAPPVSLPDSIIDSFIQTLPFELTGAQRRAIPEIIADMKKNTPMRRLLQGDVGSGKTVVAAAAAFCMAKSGWQVALMAPLETLALQHYETLKKWFAAFPINLQLLVGSMAESQAEAVREAVKSGEVDIVVGTHALFQETVTYSKLGLIIIDEQHRFGVEERFKLKHKGEQAGLTPHQLAMTATPIPRTLAMAQLGDMAITILDEKPAGRKPIVTVVMPSARQVDVITRIQELVGRGRQVYWICPLIEESEKLPLHDAITRYEELKGMLPGISVGLVHGRLNAKEKEKVITDFRHNTISVLVATTVIEVGIDVPNANLMVIEHAERMGLAQLHQLRGRVGRGTEESYCVLLYYTPISQLARERLGILRQTEDGFVIAEADLRLRGAGDMYGLMQSGTPEYRFIDLLEDHQLLVEAATYYESISPAVEKGLMRLWGLSERAWQEA